MTTYRELVYLTLDCLKISVDDAYFTEDHIIFLLNKFRGLLLKQTYKDVRKGIPDSNYQTLCLDLIQVPAVVGEECEGGTYLRSAEKIPFIIPIAIPKINNENYHQCYEFTYVSKDRMKYVGYNKWLPNIVYATIGTDNYLYFKSGNTKYLTLDRVTFTAIFEDSDKAMELTHSDTTTDILDREFPIEEPLIPQLIELVVKELSRPEYLPQDKVNNSSDDLSGAAGSNGRDK